MPVLSREYFNFAVIKQPLHELMRGFEEKVPADISGQPAAFVLPGQPHNAGADDPPLLLWTPACAPHLTAFMPHFKSGDYFVTAYASSALNLAWAAVRSSSPKVEWPINEFQCHEGGREKRFVRAFRDAPRWDFFERGPALAFEHRETYAKRFIRDRLTREMALSCMEAWGAPVREPAFWRTDAEAFTLSLAPTG